MQNRWVYQLGVLSDSLDRLDALHEQWLETSADTRPGTPEFDEALAAYQAASWNRLDDWATHGHTVLEINSAARHASSPLAPPPTTTAAPGHTPLARK